MTTNEPAAWGAHRGHAAIGRRPVGFRRAEAGGYTPAEHWLVEFEQGPSAFVKLATTENTAQWVRDEAWVYERVRGPFMAEFLGWDEGGEWPFLVLEDLSGADWPPPWKPGRVDRVLDALEAVHATAVPDGVKPAEEMRNFLSAWRHVAADPEPFLSFGLCSPQWLDRALPVFLHAERAAVLDGGDLLHLDVRSDNLCFIGHRTILVDWTWVSRGNGALDAVLWAPSLVTEGGPPPEDVVQGQPELAALITGFFAHRAGLPPPPTAPRVREIQLIQLRACLPWVARLFDLPPPWPSTPTTEVTE